MHAHRIIQNLLDTKCPEIHAKRRDCIAKVAEAGRIGGLGVVKMGRCLDTKTSIRHRIKCCDRLLSNRHLPAERLTIFRALDEAVLAGHRHIAISVDWSDLVPDGSLHLLRAAVTVKGRALVLYEEVHAECDLGSSKVHRRFLETLCSLLPDQCQPILVTDAGFRATWFKLATGMHISWVGRIRNRDMVCAEGSGQWDGCKTWYAGATAKPRCLGRFEYARSNATPCQLVLYKKAPQGRHHRTSFGKKTTSSNSKKNRAAQVEPWLLAVSPDLEALSAKQVVEIYAGRMQIEQTFRDLKNAQWGTALSESQTRAPQRLEVLLMLGALISYALWLIGLAAASAGYHINYGNTKKSGPTLSILTLARHYLADCVRPPLDRHAFQLARLTLINLVQVVKI
ncbi:IS4 family transposase [Massilia sp. GER05]|uniref:IS4 family transposase n=1 Tax=Massilia sp. GER05 TaxID=3394605 RepID=UPI003F8768AE